MSDGQTTDAPSPADSGADASASSGYRKRQVGLLGIMLIIGGVASLLNIVTPLLVDDDDSSIVAIIEPIIDCIVYCLLGLGFLWIEVEDKGDHLLVITGPCRWTWCGFGKEKIKYSEIRDYEVSQTCWLSTPEVCCLGLRILNQCSCIQCGCCGPAGSMPGGCCSQRTVRLTINERMMAHGAADAGDCCLEKCCLNNCFGEVCISRGMGCCFQPCCNPCKVNCCAVNTVYLSTNDVQGLLQVLNQKTGKSVTAAL